jgi:hypothetical protein
LTRNPVLSWIPAFAGMTNIDVINDAIYNKRSDFLQGSAGCY